MVHKRARVPGDEDSAAQVGEDNGESSRRSVRRARANDSKVSRLGGRSDTRRHRRFDRFSVKTGESITSCSGVRKGLTGLSSKPGETNLTGLNIKTGGGLRTIKIWTEGTWRNHETCAEVKQSREGDVSVRCSQKKMDHFVLSWACIVVNSLGAFKSFVENLI